MRVLGDRWPSSVVGWHDEAWLDESGGFDAVVKADGKDVGNTKNGSGSVTFGMSPNRMWIYGLRNSQLVRREFLENLRAFGGSIRFSNTLIDALHFSQALMIFRIREAILNLHARDTSVTKARLASCSQKRPPNQLTG